MVATPSSSQGQASEAARGSAPIPPSSPSPSTKAPSASPWRWSPSPPPSPSGRGGAEARVRVGRVGLLRHVGRVGHVGHVGHVGRVDTWDAWGAWGASASWVASDASGVAVAPDAVLASVRSGVGSWPDGSPLPRARVPWPPDDHRGVSASRASRSYPGRPMNRATVVVPWRLVGLPVLVRRPPRPARAVPGGGVQPGPVGAVGAAGPRLPDAPRPEATGGVRSPGPPERPVPSLPRRVARRPGTQPTATTVMPPSTAQPAPAIPAGLNGDRRAAQHEDAHGALHGGDHAGTPLDAEHADVQLDHDPRAAPRWPAAAAPWNRARRSPRRKARGSAARRRPGRAPPAPATASCGAAPADAVGEAARVVRGGAR